MQIKVIITMFTLQTGNIRFHNTHFSVEHRIMEVALSCWPSGKPVHPFNYYHGKCIDTVHSTINLILLDLPSGTCAPGDRNKDIHCNICNLDN